jgi:hypothetical protein
MWVMRKKRAKNGRWQRDNSTVPAATYGGGTGGGKTPVNTGKVAAVAAKAGFIRG